MLKRKTPLAKRPSDWLAAVVVIRREFTLPAAPVVIPPPFTCAFQSVPLASSVPFVRTVPPVVKMVVLVFTPAFTAQLKLPAPSLKTTRPLPKSPLVTAELNLSVPEVGTVNSIAPPAAVAVSAPNEPVVEIPAFGAFGFRMMFPPPAPRVTAPICWVTLGPAPVRPLITSAPPPKVSELAGASKLPEDRFTKSSTRLPPLITVLVVVLPAAEPAYVHAPGPDLVN